MHGCSMKRNAGENRFSILAKRLPAVFCIVSIRRMGEAGFARECARVGVAGIAQQVGFSGVQATAADTLANILHKCMPLPPPQRFSLLKGCKPSMVHTQTSKRWGTGRTCTPSWRGA
jgi:hypothetical protein